MKEEPALPSVATQSLLPILRAYPSSSLAIIGCHARKISRPSCEYDLLLLSDEFSVPKSLRVRNAYIDILFKKEKEVSKTSDPEFAITLSSLVPIRDNSWLLATASSECKKSFRENCLRASELRLGSALKALGRVDENIESGHMRDADFWLLFAGYEFCFASLYSSGIVPSPSHLLTQMKKIKSPSKFKEWADSIGLPLASRASCENRLGGLTVLYDLLRTVEVDSHSAVQLGRYRSKESEEILRRKSSYLIDILLSTESFTYLGYETMQIIPHLHQYHARNLAVEPSYQTIIEDITTGRDRLLSSEVIRLLGLVRSKERLIACGEALRDSIASQAKKI